MSTKKGILITGVVSIIAIASFLYLSSTSPKLDEEVGPHLEKLYALSGELTPDQKQEYAEAMTSIQSLINQNPAPKSVLKKVAKHAKELVLTNPELLLVGNMIIENKEYRYTSENKRIEDLLRNPPAKPEGYTPKRFKKAADILQNKSLAELQNKDPDMAKYFEKLFNIKTSNTP